MTQDAADRSFPATVDVAIVGSGPTGAAYARILSERSPDAVIALFEAGPVLADPPGLHVKNIADAGARTLAQRHSEGVRPHTMPPRTVPAPTSTEQPAEENLGDDTTTYADPAKRVVRAGTHLLPDGFQQPGEDGIPALAMSTNVGGMGAHWTCACPRPGDGERPDVRADLDELLDEGERLLGVDRHPFDDAPFADVVRDRLAEAYDPGRAPDRRVRPMPLAVHRRPDGGLLWSGSDVVFGEATRSNPRFTLFPEAQAVRVLVEDERAVGVVVHDRRTGTDHEVRARFVVVAADALRTPQLLWASGVRPTALGRYLNDQPQLVFAVRLRDVAGTPGGHKSGPADPAIAESSGVTWVPYTDDEPFHGQVMQLDASPIPLVDQDEPAPGSIVGLGWFCAKDIQESDRLEFDDEHLDEYGLPKPSVHYRLTEEDHDRLARAKVAILCAADALGSPIGDAPFTLASGASLHYQGTTRMGSVDDGTSVCGPTSEVWGVSGLYVAGNNVIPTSIACNPTLLSVSLAVGGARDIADRLAAARSSADPVVAATGV